jgi:hypothetical protein
MLQFTLDQDCKADDVLYKSEGNNGLSLESAPGSRAVAKFDADYAAGSVICVMIRPDGELTVASADPSKVG